MKNIKIHVASAYMPASDSGTPLLKDYSGSYEEPEIINQGKRFTFVFDKEYDRLQNGKIVVSLLGGNHWDYPIDNKVEFRMAFAEALRNSGEY